MQTKFLLLILFSPLIGLSQGVDNLWLMGYPGGGGGINLDFAGGILNISQDTTRKMEFDETNGVICNKNGNLLFYSNGVWIANNTNDTMANGRSLNPSVFTTEYAQYGEGLPITQANLIIPFPSDTNKYYLFHQTVDDYPGTYCSLYLYNSIIDMSGDSGRGAVIQKNNILLSDSLVAGYLLTACKHANGRDWWLIAHQYRTSDSIAYTSSSTLYYKFLITPDGISGPDTQSVGTGRGVASGQSVFSPDGNYFACYDAVTNLDIYDFDRCTGTFAFKTHIFINDSAFASGIAFSSNSQVLYVSSGYDVDQFDINATDIAASKTTVLTWDSTFAPYPFSTTFFLAQLAPDGKIYINCAASTTALGAVNNPDILGLSCNACQDCVPLPAFNAFTIPNYPNYFLGADSGSVCDSLTTSVQSLSVQSSMLNIYPNPIGTDEVTFNYNVSSKQGLLTIYNAEGKEVSHYILPQWSSVQYLKLPDISSGLYLARLMQGDNVSEVKFIKE